MITPFWNSIDFKGRTKGQHKLTCPACSHTRTKKNDPCLSVDLDEGVYNCHNCGVKGRKELYEPKEKREPVILPQLNTSGLSEPVFKYLNETRCISNLTLQRNKITSSEKQGTHSIWFNYYVDGLHTNTKFRTLDKRFGQVKNAEKHFYKIDDVAGSDVVIVAEGEIDALSWEDAGYKFAISIPDGAIAPNQQASDKKFEFVDNDIERFNAVTKIVLAMDNDAPGQAMQKELSRRFGRERCWIVDFGEYKDANEVLQKLGVHDGKEHLQTIYAAATQYPLAGIETVASLTDRVLEIYENGIDKGSGIGYSELDRLVRWVAGLFYVITGVPSHGKSNFVDQVMCKLLERDWKFAIYSPEHSSELHLHRLSKIMLDMPFWDTGHGRMSKDDLIQVLGFFNERVFFIKPENEDFTLDSILVHARQLVARHGIKGLLIDPWNTLDHQVPRGMDKGDYISNALSKINAFKLRNDCSVFLVAHPTKMPTNEDGTYKVPTGYSIADSAHFFNKPDIGLTVYRHGESRGNLVDVVTWKIKFEGLLGEKGTASFHFDKATSRYIEANPYMPTHNEPPERSNIPRPTDQEAQTNLLGDPIPF